MSTTVVCALIQDSALYVGWCGDSRAYIVRDGEAHQVTVDHSVVQALVDDSLLTKEEARLHPQGHTITRYLGSLRAGRPETVVRNLRDRDIVLLCSDGLTDVLTDADIAAVCSREECASTDIARRLVHEALTRSPSDNITAAVYVHGSCATSSHFEMVTQTSGYLCEVANVLSRLHKESDHERS